MKTLRDYLHLRRQGLSRRNAARCARPNDPASVLAHMAALLLVLTAIGGYVFCMLLLSRLQQDVTETMRETRELSIRKLEFDKDLAEQTLIGCLRGDVIHIDNRKIVCKDIK